MSPDQPSSCWPGVLRRTAAQTQAMSLAITLLLGACAPRPAELPAPAAPGARPDLTMPRTPSTDASLPSATSVFDAPLAAAPAAANAADPAASAVQGRANAEMSPAQESRSMPLPGQANDHSVPVSPPKAAASR